MIEAKYGRLEQWQPPCNYKSDISPWTGKEWVSPFYTVPSAAPWNKEGRWCYMSDFRKWDCRCDSWGYGDAKIIAINSIETERDNQFYAYHRKVGEDLYISNSEAEEFMKEQA